MRHLDSAQLMEALQRYPGLIPVDLDVDQQRLVWMDLQQYHCYEGFFHRALGMFTALTQARSRAAPVELCTSDIQVLQSAAVLRDPIYPTGFIFHAGRCGSTLLTKVLARSRHHLVFGEAAPHNHIWSLLTDHGQLPREHNAASGQLYKHLVLAMGRRRLVTHQAHFIKFTSFNMLFFDFIQGVFPDVPALFLYRHPADILASMSTHPPAWLSTPPAFLRAVMADLPVTETGVPEPLACAVHTVQHIFSAALRAGAHGLRYLPYAALTPANLPMILQAFHVQTPRDQLLLMQSQFSYDAKMDDRLRPFSVNRKAQQSATTGVSCARVSSKLQRLYEQLTEADGNLNGLSIA